MKTLLHRTATKQILITLLISVISGCATTTKREPSAQPKADKTGVAVVNDKPIGGTFIAPGAQFSKYKKLLVEQLDLSDVKVRNSSKAKDESVGVSEEERAYYQERYTEALMNNLILDGTYTTAIQAGTDVMTVVAKVVEVASIDNKADAKGRPANTKVYSEGVGAMTLEISLYDSMSGKPLAIITDQRRLWEETNSTASNAQMRAAFNSWLGALRKELDKVSGR